MSLFKLSSMPIQDKPLLACVFGVTRIGKSTCIGTNGSPTLYLYTMHEEHGFRTAAKMNEETFPNNPFFGVNVSRMEALDEEIKVFADFAAKKGDKVPAIGEPLDENREWHKLMFYLNNVPTEAETVAIDSLTDLFNILKSTSKFERLCTVKTKEGYVYSNFQERSAYVKMFHEIIEALQSLQDKGIASYCTISAKAKYDEEGEVCQLLPDLPMYGVVEEVIKAFPDVLPVDTAVIEGVEHRVFNMNLKVGKTQFTEKKEKKASIKTNGRLNSMLHTVSLGMEIEYLPVTLYNLKQNLEEIRAAQTV